MELVAYSLQFSFQSRLTDATEPTL